MTKRVLILVMAVGMRMEVASSGVAISLPQSQQDKMQSQGKMKNDKKSDHGKMDHRQQ